mmetsp:Transcript_4554/g.8179  ORF Transcript_4554/g.8179 Transcript_4554/m.8179 type:complete len:204 (-) Transcript_4554:390-1001(-)
MMSITHAASKHLGKEALSVVSGVLYTLGSARLADWIKVIIVSAVLGAVITIRFEVPVEAVVQSIEMPLQPRGRFKRRWIRLLHWQCHRDPVPSAHVQHVQDHLLWQMGDGGPLLIDGPQHQVDHGLELVGEPVVALWVPQQPLDTIPEPAHKLAAVAPRRAPRAPPPERLVRKVCHPRVHLEVRVLTSDVPFLVVIDNCRVPR